jgi:hypothetical protein
MRRVMREEPSSRSRSSDAWGSRECGEGDIAWPCWSSRRKKPSKPEREAQANEDRKKEDRKRSAENQVRLLSATTFMAARWLLDCYYSIANRIGCRLIA